ncbi:hypothetical protein [Pseudonocardia xishanensis]
MLVDDEHDVNVVVDQLPANSSDIRLLVERLGDGHHRVSCGAGLADTLRR